MKYAASHMNRRVFLVLPLAFSGCEYVLVDSPRRITHAFVPARLEPAFADTVGTFALEHNFTVSKSVDPLGAKIFDLTRSDIRLNFAHDPTPKSEEYGVYLYQQKNVPLNEGEIDKVWGDLKAEVIALVGNERWIEKEIKE